MAKPTWISVDKSSGTNNDSVRVTATAHTGRLNRTGTLTVGTSVGGLNQSVSIIQTGEAKITVTDKPASFSGAGSSNYKITGTANVANFSFNCASPQISNPTIIINSGSVLSGWNGDTNTTITGDPGATAAYTFELHFKVASNNTDSSKAIQITIGDTTTSAYTVLNFTQAAGTKTYANPTISAFTYPQAGAGANTVTPTISYSQTWGWNGNTSGGGTITSGASFKYQIGVDPQLPTPSINAANGQVTFTTLGTTITSASEYNVDCTITLNGKTASKRATLTRAANTITYGNASLSIVNPLSVSKDSGTLTIKPLITDAFSQTATYTSGASRTCTPDLSSTKVAFDGLKVGFVEIINTCDLKYEANDTIYDRTQKIIVTVNGEGGKVATQKINFTQRKGDATLGVVPTSLTFKATGETLQLTIKSNTSWTIS